MGDTSPSSFCGPFNAPATGGSRRFASASLIGFHGPAFAGGGGLDFWCFGLPPPLPPPRRPGDAAPSSSAALVRCRTRFDPRMLRSVLRPTSTSLHDRHRHATELLYTPLLNRERKATSRANWGCRAVHSVGTGPWRVSFLMTLPCIYRRLLDGLSCCVPPARDSLSRLVGGADPAVVSGKYMYDGGVTRSHMMCTLKVGMHAGIARANWRKERSVSVGREAGGGPCIAGRASVAGLGGVVVGS